jgi:hypothetical protein
MEMKFQAEERQERACNLGIDLRAPTKPSMTLAVKAMGYR